MYDNLIYQWLFANLSYCDKYESNDVDGAL